MADATHLHEGKKYNFHFAGRSASGTCLALSGASITCWTTWCWSCSLHLPELSCQEKFVRWLGSALRHIASWQMSRGGRRGFLVRARECCDLIGHRLPHLQLLKILGSQQQKDLPTDVPLHLIRTMEVTTVQGPKWTYQCRSEFCRAARPRKLGSTRVGKWFSVIASSRSERLMMKAWGWHAFGLWLAPL